MDRNDSILEGKSSVSSAKSADSGTIKAAIIGASDSWRVSQLLKASGIADDPSQPHYPQFTIIARVDMENSSSLPKQQEDAGFIATRFVNGTVYIVSIVVHPKYRKIGVAERLFSMVEDVATVWSCKRVAFKLRDEFKDLAEAVRKRGYEKFLEVEGIGLYVKELGG